MPGSTGPGPVDFFSGFPEPVEGAESDRLRASTLASATEGAATCGWNLSRWGVKGGFAGGR